MECQQILLVNAVTTALQQIDLLSSLRLRLSSEHTDQLMQLQWHNTFGEIKLSLHNLVDTTLFTSLDGQLSKFTATEQVVELTRVGTSLYIRLQPAILLMLAFYMKRAFNRSISTEMDESSTVLVLSLLQQSRPSTQHDSLASQSELAIDSYIRAQLLTRSVVNMLRAEGTTVYWLLLVPSTLANDQMPLIVQLLESMEIHPDEIRTISREERDSIRRELQMSTTTEDVPSHDASLLDLVPFGANRLLLPHCSDGSSATDMLLDAVYALHSTLTKTTRTSSNIVTIAPETCQMQVQQIYALLKLILSLKGRLQPLSLDLKYIPVGLVQHRSMKADYTVSNAIATIRASMAIMVDNRDDGDDSFANASSVVSATTAAAFSGIFMGTKRQKQIQLSEQPAKLLLEKGQPMVYTLYTRAKLGAILTSYSMQNTDYDVQLTDTDIAEYAKGFAKVQVAMDIAREILDYKQVTRAALDRGEPCLLVAFAVRLSRLATRACNVLRVKDCPPSIALPRVHLISMCEWILGDVIRRLGMLPLERM